MIGAKPSEDSDMVRDARRYRALRSMHWYDKGLCVTMAHNVRLGADCPSDERLDDLVDTFICQNQHFDL